MRLCKPSIHAFSYVVIKVGSKGRSYNFANELNVSVSVSRRLLLEVQLLCTHSSTQAQHRLSCAGPEDWQQRILGVLKSCQTPQVFFVIFTMTLRQVFSTGSCPTFAALQRSYASQAALQQIFLVGTAHVSKASADEVRAMITAVKPETVFVELDAQRARKLMQQGNQEEPSLMKVNSKLFPCMPGSHMPPLLQFLVCSVTGLAT